MKESKQLKIRINFRSQPKNSIATDDITYEYHWVRIFSAFVFFLIVIGGGVYYFDQGNIDQITEKQTVLSKDLEAEDLKEKKLEEINLITTLAVEDITTTANREKGSSPLHASENEQETDIQTILTETSRETSNVENIVLFDQIKSNEDEINLTITPPIEDVSGIAPLSEDNKEIAPKASTEKATEALTIENTDTPFTQFSSDIFSDKVKRFIISSSVNKNEPTGTIHDIVFDNNNLATVYAFSDVSHLKDTALYYIWILDGESVAKVKVKVGSSRWRSYSRKFIQPNMHGEWKVELRNGEGAKLASSVFYY
jgi:hypothetical protein